jgi:hypothetical protein
VNEAGVASWGEFKVRLTDRPWRTSVLDAQGRMRQEIRLDEATGAIGGYFLQCHGSGEPGRFSFRRDTAAGLLV